MNSTTQQMREKAVLLKSKGLTYAEIGNELKVSRQRAQQLVQPSLELLNLVRQRANYHCEQCSVSVKSGHVHHIKNQENYNHLDNLQYLCISCHMSKHFSTCNDKPKIAANVDADESTKQIREIIRERKQSMGTTACAKSLGISPYYVLLLLNGKRNLSNKIARKLGYEAIRVFRKAESSDKRRSNG